MSSGDKEWRSGLERPDVRVLPECCLDLTDLLPSGLGLATSAMEVVASARWGSVSPLSNSAIRADLLNGAWLRLFCKELWREVDLVPDVGGGLDLFLLVDALRSGLGFLPRPRREPLRI